MSPVPRRLALLVATDSYEDPGLSRLVSPAADVEALASVLADPDVAGFEVTTLVNEPHHRVGAAVGDLLRDRRRDDLTLLYFTGHGLKDDAGRLYLATTDTRGTTCCSPRWRPSRSTPRCRPACPGGSC